MAAPPSLDDNAKKLLRTLVSRSNFMRGAEAMKIIGMDDSKVFADLVEKLVGDHLLMVSGSASAERVEYATLSIHPENIGFVRSMF